MLLFVDCDLMLLVLLQRLDSPMALLGNISKDDGDICFDMHGEDDVPGTSLNGKKPSQLKMTSLKRWLSCRGAPTSGNKP